MAASESPCCMFSTFSNETICICDLCQFFDVNFDGKEYDPSERRAGAGVTKVGLAGGSAPRPKSGRTPAKTSRFPVFCCFVFVYFTEFHCVSN